MRAHLLSVGVNVAGGSTPLLFAEQDAVAVANAFTTARGPVFPDHATTLLGAAATRQSMRQQLQSLVGAAHVIVYFSGHGSGTGIALADGLYSYPDLGRDLHRLGARTITVILDTCHAGAAAVHIVGADVSPALMEAWDVALRAACPGVRLLAAVSSSAFAHEDPAVGGGRFTRSLLDSLRALRGDICVNGIRMISDVAAAAMARNIMQRRWPQDGAPQTWVPRGNRLPIMLSQADQIIGAVTVRNFAPTPGLGAWLALDAFDRCRIPTHFEWRVVDETGSELLSAGQTWLPQSREATMRRILMLPAHLLAAHPVSSWRLRRGAAIGTIWNLRVTDDHGHVLAAHSFERSYVLLRAG